MFFRQKLLFLAWLLILPLPAASLETIWLSDDHGAGQHWDIECVPAGCRAQAAELRVYLDNLGVIWLAHPLAGVSRVSIYDGSGKIAAPKLFSGPLTQVELTHLSQAGQWLIFERENQRDSLVQIWGFTAALGHMSAILDIPAPLSEPDTPLAHLAHRDPANQIESWAHIPHTKPQIEFAIRAQGGVSQTGEP